MLATLVLGPAPAVNRHSNTAHIFSLVAQQEAGQLSVVLQLTSLAIGLARLALKRKPELSIARHGFRVIAGAIALIGGGHGELFA